MANLGNSKIKDTYTLVLQTDASGNLQKLDGTTPNPFIVNGTLRYTVGATDGYVLTSDAVGNASWAEGGGTTYWSANTDGTISPSGLTTNVGIGTSTPNKPLTVVGDVSGTTDLYIDGNMYSGTTNLLDIFASSAITNQDVYWSANTDGSISPSGLTTTVKTEGDLRVSGTVYTNTITTTATSTDTLTIQSDIINLKSHGGAAEYLSISDDRFNFYFDGSEAIAFNGPNHGSTQYLFNAGGQDIDFKISGPSGSLFNVTADQGRIRIQDHLTIGPNGAISHTDAVKWGLGVTGSSLFYSGGTNGTNRNAISAVGDISGTTDLHIDDNIQGLRGQFGNLPAAGGATRDLDIKGDSSVYLRLQSTTNANQTIEFMNDQEPDFLIYNKHTDGGLHIASDDKSFLVIGANDGDTIDLFGNTTISGNTVVRGSISGTTDLYIDDDIYSGTTNLLDIFASSAITNQDVYWSANTDGSISPSGLTTYVGVGTDTPNVPLTVVGDISGTTNLYIDGDINGNRKFEPSSIDVGNKQGDIVYFPVEPPASTTAGSIYYYDGSTWLSTDASAVATSSGLTAVAVGTDSSEGMLIRGMVTLAASTGGVDGNVIYLSEAAGKAVTSPPASASAVVRTMGYVLDTSEKRIWFNPDNTWVELSS